MKYFWQRLSISKKLFSIVLIISLLFLFQLALIFYALGSLLSTRALIVGESIWSKAQKDAVHNLYQYAHLKDIKYLQNFYSLMEIPDGDTQARLELEKSHYNIEIVRNGFLKGQLQASEIDGIIHLLVVFKNNQYIVRAVESWAQADLLILDLKNKALDLKYFIHDEFKIKEALERINLINEALSFYEKDFSYALQEGSRSAESLFIFFIIFIVILFESVGIYLFYKLSLYIVLTLKEFKKTATEVGLGNLTVSAPVSYSDELGQLGTSLNQMILNLKQGTEKKKKAEESLRKSNERYSIMIEAVKDYAIFSLDLKGCVRSWNTGAKYLNGYSADEIIGHHFSIFYIQEDIEAGLPEKELNLAIKYGRYEREVLRLKKDGSLFWANVILKARCDKFGIVSGFSNVTRDITELKEYESKLKKSNLQLEEKIEFRTKKLQWRESQLRQITNALPECVCQLDVNQKFLFVNESFCKLMGLNKKEILSFSMLEIFGKTNYALFRKSIQDVLNGHNKSFEVQLNIHNLISIFNISLVSDFDEKMQITGFVLVAHDIRKYKEIEFELKKSKELADVANQTKSSFLANMSHEIRTPLGAILGFSELIINNEVSELQKKKFVEAIQRNGHLLSNVINDILDLSKVEAGKLEIEKVKILFDDIIKDIESLLNLKASEKGIKLSILKDEKIPQFIITDPLRLRQILLNIIGNAIKFTQEGLVEVRIKTTLVSGSQNPKLVFIIQDSGLGMTPLQVEKLFTPFSQADVSTTRKYGGSGLGLILSKKLAVALGGDVSLLNSEMNVGSTFSVMIDSGLPQHSKFKAFESNSFLLESQKLDINSNLKDFRILFVEDSLDNQLIVTHFLKSTGVEMKIANNGQEGLDYALSENFDLILLDIQMPVMGGFEAIKKMKDGKINIPIIALTAHAMKDDIKQCLEAGFNDHLSKPINKLSLVKKIEQWLHKKNQLTPNAAPKAPLNL
jgi:PAS domain S-box-containing protein